MPHTSRKRAPIRIGERACRNGQNPESLIPFVRSGRRADLLEGQVDIEISSAGLAWDGLHAERGAVRGWEVSEPAAVDGEYVAVNLSPEPLHFEGGAKRTREKITLPAGGVWVQPAGTPFRMIHGQRMTYGSLTLDSASLRRHVGHDEVRLKQFYGVDKQSAHLVQAILEEAGRGSRADPLVVDALTSALSLHLARMHGETPGSQVRTKGRLSKTALSRIVDFVDAHRSERILVTDLAGLLDMSVAHFARQFRATVGVPPHQFIRKRRLLWVQRALRRRNDTVSAIAYDHGFADQSHLTRAFRNEFGITPKQYRQALAKQRKLER